MLGLPHPDVAGRWTTLRCGVAVGSLAVLATGVARADHDMAMSDHPGDTGLSVGLSLVAAEFDNASYVGSYQGLTPSVGWMHGRFGVLAALGLYHLTENGLSQYGAGDARLGGHATVLAGEHASAGVALHVMMPTGSELAGFGMGHVMAMPSLWGSWHAQPFTVTGSAGFTTNLTDGSGVHGHGLLPLVDPLNRQEMTWSAGADLALGRGVSVGARTLGGIPVGAGITRVIGAGRVAWGTPQISTALELQLGLAGDPFTIRGVVDTALRF